MDHPARDGLLGFSMSNDRLWLIYTPDFVGGITEYNEELTGFSPELQAAEPDFFYYGGNAYYILNTLAQKKGWRVEAIEDRR